MGKLNLSIIDSDTMYIIEIDTLNIDQLKFAEWFLNSVCLV